MSPAHCRCAGRQRLRRGRSRGWVAAIAVTSARTPRWRPSASRDWKARRTWSGGCWRSSGLRRSWLLLFVGERAERDGSRHRAEGLAGEPGMAVSRRPGSSGSSIDSRRRGNVCGAIWRRPTRTLRRWRPGRARRLTLGAATQRARPAPLRLRRAASPALGGSRLGRTTAAMSAAAVGAAPGAFRPGRRQVARRPGVALRGWLAHFDGGGPAAGRAAARAAPSRPAPSRRQRRAGSRHGGRVSRIGTLRRPPRVERARLDRGADVGSSSWASSIRIR